MKQMQTHSRKRPPQPSSRISAEHISSSCMLCIAVVQVGGATTSSGWPLTIEMVPTVGALDLFGSSNSMTHTTNDECRYQLRPRRPSVSARCPSWEVMSCIVAVRLVDTSTRSSGSVLAARCFCPQSCCHRRSGEKKSSILPVWPRILVTDLLRRIFGANIWRESGDAFHDGWKRD